MRATPSLAAQRPVDAHVVSELSLYAGGADNRPGRTSYTGRRLQLLPRSLLVENRLASSVGVEGRVGAVSPSVGSKPPGALSRGRAIERRSGGLRLEQQA